VTGLATARSLLDLVTDSALDYPLPANLPGQCVSLNFVADAIVKVGFSGQVDATHGASLASGIYFQDSATGAGGNTIPIGQIYLYAASTATVTVYLRFIG
jgi:hypothetical protein